MSEPISTTWTFGEIVDALGDLVVAVAGARDTVLTGATADSRQALPGHCFVAVRGYTEDGMRHWPAARAAGATALVCESAPPESSGVPWARVRNGYAAAGLIAELVWGRPADALELIGITGTNGKTTCAYLLDQILVDAGRQTGMIGTVAYKIGNQQIEADRTTPMPFALQELLTRMREACATTVTLEVSSHALAQRRLGTAKFTAALFTNLTGDHLDYHHTMEEYYDAKRQLFVEDLRAGGHAVINVDTPYGQRLHDELTHAQKVHSHSFSMAGAEAEFQLEQVETAVEGGRGVLRRNDGNEFTMRLQTPMIGHYNLCNVGCVAALALVLDVSPAVIKRCTTRFHGAPGRLEPIRIPGKPAVFVDYAHTDDALENALKALAAVKKHKLAVVFGCGGDRDPSKRPRMARIAEAWADRVYATSDNPRSENSEAILDNIFAGFVHPERVARIPDRRQAIRTALAEADPNDILLIAGKGHETYQEINGVKHPFDDACEVRKALAENVAQ